VRAYKFLRREGTTLMTGFRWPIAEWVDVEGPLEWCANGIHACRIEDLPHWLGAELWAAELDGETLATPDSIVARRGRLLERVENWSAGAAQEFAQWCARRASELARGAPSAAARAVDAGANADIGAVAGAAYIAAAVAGEVGSGSRTGVLYQRQFLAERARQSQWIRARLSLDGS
jgi:hypothetical protein